MSRQILESNISSGQFLKDAETEFVSGVSPHPLGSSITFEPSQFDASGNAFAKDVPTPGGYFVEGSVDFSPNQTITLNRHDKLNEPMYPNGPQFFRGLRNAPTGVIFDEDGMLTGPGFAAAGAHTLKAAVRHWIPFGTVNGRPRRKLSRAKWVDFKIVVKNNITVSKTTPAFTGSGLEPDIEIFPAKRKFSVTYNSSSALPVNAGEYNLKVTAEAWKDKTRVYPVETWEGKFTIRKAKPTIDVKVTTNSMALSQPAVVSVVNQDKVGMAAPVVVTYDGKATPPDKTKFLARASLSATANYDAAVDTLNFDLETFTGLTVTDSKIANIIPGQKFTLEAGKVIFEKLLCDRPLPKDKFSKLTITSGGKSPKDISKFDGYLDGPQLWDVNNLNKSIRIRPPGSVGETGGSGWLRPINLVWLPDGSIKMESSGVPTEQEPILFPSKQSYFNWIQLRNNLRTPEPVISSKLAEFRLNSGHLQLRLKGTLEWINLKTVQSIFDGDLYEWRPGKTVAFKTHSTRILFKWTERDGLGSPIFRSGAYDDSDNEFLEFYYVDGSRASTNTIGQEGGPRLNIRNLIAPHLQRIVEVRIPTLFRDIARLEIRVNKGPWKTWLWFFVNNFSPYTQGEIIGGPSYSDDQFFGNFEEFKEQDSGAHVLNRNILVYGQPANPCEDRIDFELENSKVKGTFLLSAKGSETKINVSNLTQTYSNSGLSPTVSVLPKGLQYEIDYGTVGLIPTNGGIYNIKITVLPQADEFGFYNSSEFTGKFVIEKAKPKIELETRKTYSQPGDGQIVNYAVTPYELEDSVSLGGSKGGIPVQITYDGKTLPNGPAIPGKYKVSARITASKNWEATETLADYEILKVKPRVKFVDQAATKRSDKTVYSNELQVTQNGKPQAVKFEVVHDAVSFITENEKFVEKTREVAVSPNIPGYSVSISYGSSSAAPTEPGVYTVKVEVKGDRPYMDSVTATAKLTILSNEPVNWLANFDKNRTHIGYLAENWKVFFGPAGSFSYPVEIGSVKRKESRNFGWEWVIETKPQLPLGTALLQGVYWDYDGQGTELDLSFHSRYGWYEGWPPRAAEPPVVPAPQVTKDYVFTSSWTFVYALGSWGQSRNAEWEEAITFANPAPAGAITVSKISVNIGDASITPVVRFNNIVADVLNPKNFNIGTHTGNLPRVYASILYLNESTGYRSYTPPSEAGVYKTLVFALLTGNNTAPGTGILGFNQAGYVTGEYQVNKLKSTVSIGTTGDTIVPFNGSPQGVKANTTPANLSVVITYNGSSKAPTAPGTYKVVVTVPATETTLAASASENLIITKGNAEISFTNTKRQYNGTPQTLTVSTQPPELNVSTVYDEIQGFVPKSIGTWSVVATVQDANYVGTKQSSLEITAGVPRIKPNQVFTFRPGSPVTVQLVADDSFNRPVTMWQVKSTTAMPAGLKFNTRTGAFSGLIDAFGTIALTIVATGPGGTDEKAVTFRADPAAVFMGKSPIKSLGDVQKLYYGNIQLYP